jgi:hypothetical protein
MKVLDKNQFYAKWQTKLREAGIKSDLTQTLENLWKHYLSLIEQNQQEK